MSSCCRKAFKNLSDCQKLVFGCLQWFCCYNWLGLILLETKSNIIFGQFDRTLISFRGFNSKKDQKIFRLCFIRQKVSSFTTSQNFDDNVLKIRPIKFHKIFSQSKMCSNSKNVLHKILHWSFLSEFLPSFHLAWVIFWKSLSNKCY